MLSRSILPLQNLQLSAENEIKWIILFGKLSLQIFDSQWQCELNKESQ